MAFEVKIPQLGVTMQEGTLVEWLKSDGDAVVAGDPIYLLETDKAENEIVSPSDGVLRTKVEAGETYPVGTIVAVIE